MARRVRTLHRVIERAHPRRGPQPGRRFDRQRRIEDDHPGLQARVGNPAFHPGRFVGDAAPRRELASRQSGRHRDMQHLACARRLCSRCAEIDDARAGATAHQLPRRVLHGVDRAAAAETHHRVGADAARLGHQLRDRMRRYMLSGAGEHPGNCGAGRVLDLVEQFRAAERLAGHDERSFRSAPRQFASEGFGLADAEDNRLESREMVFASGLVQFLSPDEK